MALQRVLGCFWASVTREWTQEWRSHLVNPFVGYAVDPIDKNDMQCALTPIQSNNCWHVINPLVNQSHWPNEWFYDWVHGVDWPVGLSYSASWPWLPPHKQKLDIPMVQDGNPLQVLDHYTISHHHTISGIVGVPKKSNDRTGPGDNQIWCRITMRTPIKWAPSPRWHGSCGARRVNQPTSWACKRFHFGRVSRLESLFARITFKTHVLFRCFFCFPVFFFPFRTLRPACFPETWPTKPWCGSWESFFPFSNKEFVEGSLVAVD